MCHCLCLAPFACLTSRDKKKKGAVLQTTQTQSAWSSYQSLLGPCRGRARVCDRLILYSAGQIHLTCMTPKHHFVPQEDNLKLVDCKWLIIIPDFAHLSDSFNWKTRRVARVASQQDLFLLLFRGAGREIVAGTFGEQVEASVCCDGLPVVTGMSWVNSCLCSH